MTDQEFSVWNKTRLQVRGALEGALDMLPFALLGLLFCSAIVFLMVAVIKSAAASGKVEHCYVEAEWRYAPGYATEVFTVTGHRSWRPDQTIAIVSSLESAAMIKGSSLCGQDVPQ
jgi:hypothetical protein